MAKRLQPFMSLPVHNGNDSLLEENVFEENATPEFDRTLMSEVRTMCILSLSSEAVDFEQLERAVAKAAPKWGT